MIAPRAPGRGRGRRPRSRPVRAFLAVLAAAGLPLGARVAPAAAQTPAEVRAVCVGGGGSVDRCTGAALAARALMGDAAFLTGLGSEVAGSGSTLGRRIGHRPRMGWTFRVAGAPAEVPDVFAQPGLRAGTISFGLPAVHLGAAAGILDGFSPFPTVGGVLSLDALASIAWVMPPGDRGFRGSGPGFSLGVRAGLLRESFTLPGASVSITRRYPGDIRLGDLVVGDPVQLAVDPAVTSIRITIGKELFGLGLMAGTGWDHHDADVLLELAEDGRGPLRMPTSLGGRRQVWFGSVSWTFLLLQLSAEGGWASGFDPVSGADATSFDAGRGTAYGGLGLRFTP